MSSLEEAVSNYMNAVEKDGDIVENMAPLVGPLHSMANEIILQAEDAAEITSFLFASFHCTALILDTEFDNETKLTAIRYIRNVVAAAIQKNTKGGEVN